jgi:hypothetical protein
VIALLLLGADGGEGNEGWMYNSLAVTTAAWGTVHSCNTTVGSAVTAKTPFDGGGRELRCQRYAGCPSTAGSRVMWCLFDGYHGDWPNPYTDELGTYCSYGLSSLCIQRLSKRRRSRHHSHHSYFIIHIIHISSCNPVFWMK